MEVGGMGGQREKKWIGASFIISLKSLGQIS